MELVLCEVIVHILVLTLFVRWNGQWTDSDAGMSRSVLLSPFIDLPDELSNSLTFPR